MKDPRTRQSCSSANSPATRRIARASIRRPCRPLWLGRWQAVDIPREQVYVTNAVKHFKFELRGKRRLHKKPVDAEIAACHDWLKREIELVAPRLLIALGATAARSLLGRATPITANRGRLHEYAPGISLLITVHPSFLLRVPEQNKDDEYHRFVTDLKLARPFLHHPKMIAALSRDDALCHHLPSFRNRLFSLSTFWRD